MYDQKTPFTDWADHWISVAEAAGRNPRTVTAHRGALRNHLIRAFGTKQVGDIRRTDITALVTRLQERLCPTNWPD